MIQCIQSERENTVCVSSLVRNDIARVNSHTHRTLHDQRDVHPTLVQRWASTADGGPTLPKHMRFGYLTVLGEDALRRCGDMPGDLIDKNIDIRYCDRFTYIFIMFPTFSIWYTNCLISRRNNLILII